MLTSSFFGFFFLLESIHPGRGSSLDVITLLSFTFGTDPGRKEEVRESNRTIYCYTDPETLQKSFKIWMKYLSRTVLEASLIYFRVLTKTRGSS